MGSLSPLSPKYVLSGFSPFEELHKSYKIRNPQRHGIDDLELKSADKQVIEKPGSHSSIILTPQSSGNLASTNQFSSNMSIVNGVDLSVPNLHTRYVCGIRTLREMIKYSNFEPVLPLYHHYNHSGDVNLFSTNHCGYSLPIITEYELMKRVQRKKLPKRAITVNTDDGLPVIQPDTDSNVRPHTNTTAAVTPLPEFSTCLPPITCTWSEWCSYSHQ